MRNVLQKIIPRRGSVDVHHHSARAGARRRHGEAEGRHRRLRRPRHRRHQQILDGQSKTSNWSPWPTCSRTSSKRASSASETTSASPRSRTAVKVAPDKRFTGFDAFKKLIASDVDIVMLATPPGYRPEHFEAAINAGKHVFCEKPIATDPVGRAALHGGRRRRREEKKLTVVTGAQRRSQSEYIETRRQGAGRRHRRHPGAAIRNYLSGPVMHAKARDAKWGDMEWEHRNWYSFLWICGDQIVEQHFHNIDCMNWFMGTHPVKVVASGGVGLASARGAVRQHLRPPGRGFRLPQRRAPVQPLPAVSARCLPQGGRPDRRHQGQEQLARTWATKRP